nr:MULTISPECIES: nucleotide exchange factor GrpE [Myxococcaceae]
MRSVERHQPASASPPESTDPTEPAASDEAGVELSVEGAPEPSGAPAADAAQLQALRAELESVRAQLELSQAKGREMMEKIKDSHERALRAAADLDNFKKRAAKEKEDVQKFGSEKLLKDLLPVVDNLERALEASSRTPDLASLEKGVAMTRKLFEDTLGRHGVKGFSAKGQPFDPRLHEAMQQVPTADVPAGHVAFEVLRGFTLNDRLVRPALVAVAVAPPAPAAVEAQGPVAEAPAQGSTPESGNGSAEGQGNDSSGGSR